MVSRVAPPTPSRVAVTERFVTIRPVPLLARQQCSVRLSLVASFIKNHLTENAYGLLPSPTSHHKLTARKHTAGEPAVAPSTRRGSTWMGTHFNGGLAPAATFPGHFVAVSFHQLQNNSLNMPSSTFRGCFRTHERCCVACSCPCGHAGIAEKTWPRRRTSEAMPFTDLKETS